MQAWRISIIIALDLVSRINRYLNTVVSGNFANTVV
jgi:hypothetical protein